MAENQWREKQAGNYGGKKLRRKRRRETSGERVFPTNYFSEPINTSYPVAMEASFSTIVFSNIYSVPPMSLPCSDQDDRPSRMKEAMLPPEVEHLRCWCGDLCKVREVTYFSDKLGMKIFMCANYEHDPHVQVSPYAKPQIGRWKRS